MSIKIRSLLILFLCLVLTNSATFSQIPIGSFRDHLPYNGFHSIAITPEIVYAASNSSIMCYHKSDESLTTLSTVEGLSENSPTSIYYDAASRYLVVAYQNANLDFIKDDCLKNVADIKNKSITGDKSVNSFFSYQGLLYVACSFGIVSIDLSTLLVRDTWYTQSEIGYCAVNQMDIFQDYFYIATDKGIFRSPISNPAAADFSTWERIEELGTDRFSLIHSYRDRLYTAKTGTDEKDTLLYFCRGNWNYVNTIEAQPLRSVATTQDEMVICSWNYVYDLDTNGLSSYGYTWEANLMWQNARDVKIDGNTLWIADLNNGLVRIQRQWGVVKILTANGPYSASAFKMDCQQGVLALAPGMLTSTFGNGYINPNFSYFNNGTWTNILQKDNPVLGGCFDLVSVAVNPRNTAEMYGGLYGGGLVKYNQTGVSMLYDRSNSPLSARDTSDAQIAGLAFDENNNLWVGCSYSSVPLNVLKSDGTWQRFPLSAYIPAYSTAVGQILVDSRNFKWIMLPRNNTIIVLDDRNTISNLSDDRVTRVNMNIAANMETSSVNCMAEDKEGQIWIGANAGIKVIYNPANIFAGTANPQNILLEQINYVQNLFEFEEVTAIAVDDANRKWVGTAKSGVYLISKDGLDELLHFTQDNSPLLSNRIFDITINRENGEVFFATDGGLISYRGTATMGKEDYKEVSVFPNPVRETYYGTIAVSGLMDNSFCKIADAAGNLVWQGYANGGELIWDGKDFYGKRPATGVYFVFSSDETGKEKNVAKILFIK